MTDLEIGEFAGCTHGPNGKRKAGCIPCAIDWHTERQVFHAERAEFHAKMLHKLADEQIARKMEA